MLLVELIKILKMAVRGLDQKVDVRADIDGSFFYCEIDGTRSDGDEVVIVAHKKY